MSLYYFPVLIRSDRYFVTRLEDQTQLSPDDIKKGDFNFVVPVEDRVLTPIITIEDPGKLVLNQMAPSSLQDIPLNECTVSLLQAGSDFHLVLKRTGVFKVETFKDSVSGLSLDYSEGQKRILLGYYRNKVENVSFIVHIQLDLGDGNCYSGQFHFGVAPSLSCHRVVIDFGSEASQVAYRNCGPQSAIVQYDILDNIISQLNRENPELNRKREDFLNYEPGQPMLYRSFYAIRKKMSTADRSGFPFNFTSSLEKDELRLFITRKEASATHYSFRENYEIVPNLKLGIEKSLQLELDTDTEDYSIRSHQHELISAVLLRILRLMLATKPSFRKGGMIITLLVPNIYTQHSIFALLNELRDRTPSLLSTLGINLAELSIEFETISESDAAFMGYQQTHAAEVGVSNGEAALVIDCGKGTTDISMLIADENENYSSFFRTGFAGAGNVLLYGFAEDFLTLVLKAIPGTNDISVKEFMGRHMIDQHLTADVLNFLQLMEDHKRRFSEYPAVSLPAFSELAELSQSTERTIGNLHKDPSTLLRYAEVILKDRSIRWDDAVTGLISKATDCIVYSVIASIQDVMTRDIKKRIKVVMLTGRAFYFADLKEKMHKALTGLLGTGIRIKTVAPGRAINNKNVAVFGAFSGAYKITDFTGMPIDKKQGLSANNDVLNNNMYLYRGIKIQPGNDILYNNSVVRRNNLELKGFRNKTVDIYFTRDNIYLRLMENQQVKEVKSLYNVLTSVAENCSPVQDMKAISMFPGSPGDVTSIASIYSDINKDKELNEIPVKKRQGVFQFLNF